MKKFYSVCRDATKRHKTKKEALEEAKKWAEDQGGQHTFYVMEAILKVGRDKPPVTVEELE